MLAKIIYKSIFLLLTLVFMSCVIYPAILLSAGKLFFPFQSNGSLIYNKHNQLAGSLLIAQEFTKEEYFHSRPSAVFYNAASSSSSLAVSNSLLRRRVENSIKELEKYNKTTALIPADLVTVSASGLDPHISLQGAEYQLERVSKKWASLLKRNPVEVRQEIEEILQENAFTPLGGLAGEKIINVLSVNLILSEKFLQ